MMDGLEFKTTQTTTFRCLTRLEEGKAKFTDHLQGLSTSKESKYHSLWSRWQAKFSTINPLTACLWVTNLSLMRLASMAQKLGDLIKARFWPQGKIRTSSLTATYIAPLMQHCRMWVNLSLQLVQTRHSLLANLKIRKPTMSWRSACWMSIRN